MIRYYEFWSNDLSTSPIIEYKMTEIDNPTYINDAIPKVRIKLDYSNLTFCVFIKIYTVYHLSMYTIDMIQDVLNYLQGIFKIRHDLPEVMIEWCKKIIEYIVMFEKYINE